MNLPRFFVKRPVAILMLVCIIILLGTVSWSKLALDLFPEIKLPIAAVVVDYSGAGPQEVEKLVTQPLEEAIGTINNVDNIRSQSQRGNSVVIVMFDWGTDMDFAVLEMREKIDLIKAFLPDDTSSPLVIKMDPNMMPIIMMSMTGNYELAELNTIAEDLKPNLERIEGVGSVAITGGLGEEIEVLVNPAKAQGYGVSLDQIIQTMRAENLNVSAGEVTEGRTNLAVRATGEFKDVEEIKNLVFSTAQGKVRLSDLAEVREGFAEVNQHTRTNGRSAIGVHILKQTGANTVLVSERVNKVLQQEVGELPGDVQVEVVFDQADFIREAIDNMTKNAVLGGIFAVLVLYLFLGSLRSTLIISTAIPISLIATFCMIYFGGLTLNLVSLGGLALGVGMMVDNAIVILENIYRYRQEGYSLLEAAAEGSQEVAGAVVASTLTTIAVFIPIIFVEGITVQIFRQLALAVAFSLFASLLVSLTFIPTLSSRFLKLRDEERSRFWHQRLLVTVSDYLTNLKGNYRGVLVWALGHRKAVILLVTVAMVLSLALVPLIGAEFLPSADGGEISVSLELPKGSVLEETDRITRQVETILEEIPEVKTIFTSVGSSGTMMGGGSGQTEQSSLWVQLVPLAERQRSDRAVAAEIREKLQALAGAEIAVSAVDMMSSGMMSGAPVEITIKGDDLEQLALLGEEVARRVKKVPGTAEVETSLSEEHPEVVVKVNRDRAAAYGLSGTQISSAVRAAMYGQVPTTLRRDGDEIDIRVRYPEEYRQSLDDLKNLIVTSPLGLQVPLKEVAEVEMVDGPITIDRDGQARKVSITADLTEGTLAEVMTEIQAGLENLPLPSGYVLEYGGEHEEMDESFESLTIALILAVVLVYMVLAIQFESLLYPFIIMFSLPVTFIGVALGLALTGRTLNVVSFIGLIVLVGIVVNNGIVLLDYINTLRRRGMERNEAVIEGGATRLRPILMTASTTILALIPLTIGLGEGDEMQSPMATVVVGGLLVSTLITLVLVPVVYTLFDDLGQRLQAKIEPSTSGRDTNHEN